MKRKGSGREYGSAHRSEDWEEDPVSRSYGEDEEEEEPFDDEDEDD